MTELQTWSAEFTARAMRRKAESEPDWGRECRLHPAVVRSLQKFQVGESGDGAHLIAMAAASGDRDYETAVRLFVAEEQNHARMLAQLLSAAGASTKRVHWSDEVFVRLRRLLGLRLEIMVLAVAEIVALRYYRALADGGDDELLRDVSERILGDERHHVPFQCRRLKFEFGGMPTIARFPMKQTWRLLALGVAVIVAVDHGPALGVCGVTRKAFVAETMRLFDEATATIFNASVT